MRIAVPLETQTHEKRVAATPETVKKFIAAGCEVVLEKGAGEAARFPDAAYAAVGATLAENFKAACSEADLVLKVAPLNENEIAQLKPGAVVAGHASPFTNPCLKQYNEHQLSYFCMEMIPRISRAQSMDVLSSQANIAGYKAVLMATEYYQRFFPMLMTAAGTVQPAKVLVLGAGVAGLQAIATAKRLGAMIEAFDVRAAAKEQVESLGAKFIRLEGVDAEDERGYARELNAEEKAQLESLVADRCAAADIIITTAQIPGRPSPELIKPETVEKMRPGSVIIDLAAAGGGNCKLTRADELIVHQGVTLVGVTNVPSLMATDASQLYAKNLLNFISLMLDKETATLAINLDDEVIESSLLCHQGEFRKPQLIGESAVSGEAGKGGKGEKA